MRSTIARAPSRTASWRVLRSAKMRRPVDISYTLIRLFNSEFIWLLPLRAAKNAHGSTGSRGVTALCRHGPPERGPLQAVDPL